MTLNQKDNKDFKRLRPWLLVILGTGFTLGGILKILYTGPSFGINQTKQHFQVYDGWVYLLFGLLFYAGLFYNFLKKNKE